MTFRKLIVRGESWSYYVGRTCAVIRAPGGQKKVVRLSDLTGRPPHVMERGLWKRTSDASVTPRDVADYIERSGMIDVAKQVANAGRARAERPATRRRGKGRRAVNRAARRRADRAARLEGQLDARGAWVRA